MKLLVIPVVLISLLTSGAQALTHDNGHYYVWGDPDQAMFDNFAVVRPGDSIRLNIFTNDLELEIGPVGVNGFGTVLRYDMSVIDTATIAPDEFGIDVDGNGLQLIDTDADGIADSPAPGSPDIPCYYAARWGVLTRGTIGPGELEIRSKWSVPQLDAGEDRLILSVSFTIQDDAPIGETQIGLTQYFMPDPSVPGFPIVLADTIDVGDPYAMTLNVVPEPATMSLLAVGGLAFLCRKRG